MKPIKEPAESYWFVLFAAGEGRFVALIDEYDYVKAFANITDAELAAESSGWGMPFRVFRFDDSADAPKAT